MQVIVLITFGFIFLAGLFRPGLAAATAILQFAVEQMLQGFVDYLRSTRIGLVLTNAVVLLIAVLCSIRTVVRIPRPFVGMGSPTFLLLTGLLAWSVFSLAWSPSKEKGMSSVVDNLPYMVLLLGVCGFLLHDLKTADSFCRSILVVSTVATVFVLVNPEFVNRWGRLGFAIGFENERSNPLALGEMGGAAAITGLLLRDQRGRSILFWNIMRLAGIGAGLALSIQSGSRGQVLFAIAVATAFFPVAAPVKDIRRFILTILGLALLGGFTMVLMSTLLYGFEAERFSFNEIFYGQSSTQGRVQNVLVLATAWGKNPFFWMFGLGYYAFSDLYSAKTDPYSHVLLADSIFELGIPGLTMFVGAVYFSIRSYIRLFWEVVDHPGARATAATLSALTLYQLLLVNKQGYLWGAGTFYLLIAASGRLVARLPFEEFEPAAVSPEDADEGLQDPEQALTAAAAGT